MSDAGKRRPEIADLQPLLDKIGEGQSLRSACKDLGLDPPSTHTWLNDDATRRQQYERAREMRAEFYQEEALLVTKAAALGQQVANKKVDPSGARAYLDAIKWATGRMAPKTAPIQRHDHTFGDLSDRELDERIAALTTADEPPADA